DAADFRMSASAEALVDGVVFAVDREKLLAFFFGGGHDQFTSGYEDFFVGESGGFAELDGFVRGSQANGADRGGDDDFRLRVRADSEDAFATVMDFRRSNSLLAEAAGEFVSELGVRHGDEFGRVAGDLGNEFVEILARGEGDDFEFPWKGVDDGKRL